MITPPQIVNMPVLAHDFLHILIRYIGCFLFHFSPPKNLKNILKTGMARTLQNRAMLLIYRK